MGHVIGHVMDVSSCSRSMSSFARGKSVMVLSIQRALTRRGVVRGLAVTAAAGAGSGLFAPYLSRANDRAALTHGFQSGDISASSGGVWAGVGRTSRVRVRV